MTFRGPCGQGSRTGISRLNVSGRRGSRITSGVIGPLSSRTSWAAAPAFRAGRKNSGFSPTSSPAVGGDDPEGVALGVEQYPAEHRQIRVVAHGVAHLAQRHAHRLAGHGDCGDGHGSLRVVVEQGEGRGELTRASARRSSRRVRCVCKICSTVDRLRCSRTRAPARRATSRGVGANRRLCRPYRGRSASEVDRGLGRRWSLLARRTTTPHVSAGGRTPRSTETLTGLEPSWSTRRQPDAPSIVNEWPLP